MENNNNFRDDSNNYVSTQLSTNDELLNNNSKFAESNKKNRRGGFKRVMSYVLVGVICTTIGGAASGAAAIYALPKMGLIKSIEAPAATASNAAAQVSSPASSQISQLSTATSGTMTITDIANKVGPAVVAVTTTSQVSSGRYGGQSVQQGVGSGMIINEDGYVLTNYHVVEGAQQVKVVLSTGKEVNAKVVNYDANYDVAVVKITDKIQVPAVVTLGDSNSLQVGETVVAIGNPLGTEFFGSVTTGIVSALNRKISNDTNQLSYIQTDAAINSGNSGGPLINSKGQVVGINTAKIQESGVEGLGFAIPIAAIADKIPDLSKPMLLIGIQGREIDSALSKQYNLPVGLYIQAVTELSPAEKAGLKAGDIIVKFDGQKVSTFDEINTLKNKHKSGDEISVTVNRDGKETNLTLKLTDQA